MTDLNTSAAYRLMANTLGLLIDDMANTANQVEIDERMADPNRELSKIAQSTLDGYRAAIDKVRAYEREFLRNT